MEVGRIFFHPPNEPTRATVIALASHVGNVVALVKAWDDRKAYQADCSQLQRTRQLLITAAERHDEAKPETFRVTNEDGRWGYSFRGHRFRVPCDDSYVDALIKMHHEFSVDGVAEWQARLRRELGDDYACNFPFDLYTLEMCDQVAAEVESYAFDDNADERAFMELHSRWRDKANGVVEVEPFPFDPSPLTLTLRYAEFSVADELRNDAKLTDALKEWKPQPAELKERTVMLCSP
jgi:hypothetical protein